MMFPGLQHFALAALISAMAMSTSAVAQQPATPPPATADSPAAPPPATADKTAEPGPVEAKPAEAKPADPAPPAATAVPAETPAPPPAAATETKPDTPEATAARDPFGEEFMMSSRKIVTLRGAAKWDGAFDALMNTVKTMKTALDGEAIRASGNVMIVYTATDDAGFKFFAAIPVDGDPKKLPKDITISKSPEGKALKFVHRGSYDTMDNTYEAITNYLDEKGLESKDTFIEDYVTDPLTTAEDQLVINVYVPMK